MKIIKEMHHWINNNKIMLNNKYRTMLNRRTIKMKYKIVDNRTMNNKTMEENSKMHNNRFPNRTQII